MHFSLNIEAWPQSHLTLRDDMTHLLKKMPIYSIFEKTQIAMFWSTDPGNVCLNYPFYSGVCVFHNLVCVLNHYWLWWNIRKKETFLFRKRATAQNTHVLCSNIMRLRLNIK